jgi:hypothetical protein
MQQKFELVEQAVHSIILFGDSFTLAPWLLLLLIVNRSLIVIIIITIIILLVFYCFMFFASISSSRADCNWLL